MFLIDNKSGLSNTYRETNIQFEYYLVNFLEKNVDTVMA